MTKHQHSKAPSNPIKSAFRSVPKPQVPVSRPIAPAAEKIVEKRDTEKQPEKNATKKHDTIQENTTETATKTTIETLEPTNLTPDQQLMLQMGLPIDFSTTKGHEHADKSSKLSAVFRKSSKLRYNQYMGLKKGKEGGEGKKQYDKGKDRGGGKDRKAGGKGGASGRKQQDRKSGGGGGAKGKK